MSEARLPLLMQKKGLLITGSRGVKTEKKWSGDAMFFIAKNRPVQSKFTGTGLPKPD